MFDLTITIDLIVVMTCAALLLRFGRISHSHPGTIYLFFHLYTFTARTISIAFGAPTLFSNLGDSFMPVTHEEIARAMMIADVVLAIMTGAWIKASADDLKRVSGFTRFEEHTPPPNLSLQHILLIGRFTFPLGVVAVLAFSYIPSVENLSLNIGEWETSSWLLIIQSWAGLTMLAFIYWSGFKWHLMLPMSIYLMIMAVQGFHRFRVILPVLLLVQIYLDRHKLKWPSFQIYGLMLALLLLFFPLKTIGSMFRSGAGITDVVDTSSKIISRALSGEADDQGFLDQFACAVTLIDENGKFYYGKPYLALLTLPIPRFMWADKPGLADYIGDFSRPWRPMKEMGMIVTLLGDAYANFGYVGLIFMPAFVAYLLGRFYFHAYRNDYYSIARFAYLMVAVNIIQVYRDGLLSVIIFTLVNMMPLTAMLLLHYFFPVKARPRRMGLGSSLPPGSNVLA